MTCETHGHHGLDSCVLHVPIFRGASQQEVALLHHAVHSRLYRKGELVFQDGEPSDALYVVNRGVVKVSKLADTGKEHILRFLFHGDFGGMSALFKEGYHHANAEAVEDAVVCRIYRDDLRPILDNNFEMAYRFLAALTERLRDADEWAGSISLLSSERRLAKTLLIFNDKVQNSDTNELPVAKRELAALMGMTPETLSRKLTSFESQGFISLKGRKGIQILDTNALVKIASGFS
ncbi:Crp/Fnr family transcriptional regulator [Alicyclobacillus tolerans]|uniref:Crp/Fnr family transcriptional regulator n=1 Tax=Alicyclobacillus tolerans TaxID=90970 RepID=UPI001F1CF4ED|nr:Crp/Fnr family transcriptional regulator [Alicyclobacillus tolerans]MCF8565496.1 Crp/Fnr family transcriptional regulator [Alicyclobacillus tolerans]